MGFDLADVITRVIKYILEGLAVALAMMIIPQKKMVMEEVVSIAVVAALTFAILDLLAPAIGATSRQGAGLGLGLKLVGFP
jgi:hypothetical protein